MIHSCLNQHVNTSTLYSKPLMVLSLLLALHRPADAQKEDSTDLVSVTLHLVGKGTTEYANAKDWGPGYFTMATVSNTQDTTIHFYIMTCSWPGDNWVVSNDSVIFWYPGCDSNFPERIELLPHQSIHFYGILFYSRKKPVSKNVKLGFIYYKNFNNLFSWSGQERKMGEFKKYWSNAVELKDNLLDYQKD